MEEVARTERLKIAKISKNDAPFIFELVNSPSWIKYIGDRNIKTVDDAENYIENTHLKSYKTNGFGFYKVLLKAEDDKAIGTCGLAKRSELEDIDMGFGFLPDYEGKGYGLECSLAIMELAKSQFHIKKLTAITLPTNHNSVRLLEKLGMRFEKKVIPFEDDEELLLFAKDL